MVGPKSVHLMSDTFCIMPWKHLHILSDGKVKMSCAAINHVTMGGEEATIYKHSLNEIWNSEYMQQARFELANSRWPTACYICKSQESKGLPSYRHQFNNSHQSITKISSNNRYTSSFEELVRQAKDFNGALKDDFYSLQIDIGNLCNLKCRMCSSSYSSQIERDPVHSRWCPEVEVRATNPTQLEGKDRHGLYSPDFMVNQLLGHPSQLLELNIIGGEPLLSDSLRDALETLANRGFFHETSLQITTNGTKLTKDWIRIFGQFKSLCISISLDGVGRTYEYIRAPARWSKLRDNLSKFLELENAKVFPAITIQAYNILEMPEIVREVRRMGFNISGFTNVLEYPDFLSVKVLPPRIRQFAAKRLREFVRDDCPEILAPGLGQVAIALDQIEEGYDYNMLNTFMMFNNDLDASRGQSFQETFPELFAMFEEEGFTWSNKTRFSH